MDLHDRRNVQRVIRLMARQWKCPAWRVSLIIQQLIDKNWEISKLYPERKAQWDQYFPDGKPTAEQYILWLGRAHERNETMPHLLID